jgi:signal transduction histidine kinase
MPSLHSLAGLVNSSLRVKVTLGVVLPLLLILGVFTGIEYVRHEEVLLSNLSVLATQTSQVIEDILRQAMLTRNLEQLQHTLDAIGEGTAIRDIHLLDTDGRVVFTSDSESAGIKLDNSDPDCQPCHRLDASDRPGSVVIQLEDGQRVFRSMNPIENRSACQRCHDADQRLIGLLLTDISMEPLEASLAADLRENLLWWTGTIVVTVIVVNLAMSRFVIQRLVHVAHALANFGRDQLEIRLPAGSEDEIGQLTAAFNEMGQRIQDEEAENRVLSDNVQREAAQRYELLKRLIHAQEEERRRVARDLHDDLGQDLSALAFSLEVAERMCVEQPERAYTQLRQARALIADATERAYAVIMSLRPSVLDDLGLAPALNAHMERALSDAGVRFEIKSHELRQRLPPEIEIALFRTFQEALTNVLRHAKAHHVCVSLASRDHTFEGEIFDDGQGFDLQEVQLNGHAPRGLGLLGMQERVAQCGGTLDIASRPGSGTRLRICIPLPEMDGG